MECCGIDRCYWTVLLFPCLNTANEGELSKRVERKHGDLQGRGMEDLGKSSGRTEGCCASVYNLYVSRIQYFVLSGWI